MMITKFKLFENPNSIMFKNDIKNKPYTYWTENEDYAFSYYKLKDGPFKFFGDYYSHDRLHGDISDSEYLEDYEMFYGRGKLSGRLFMKFKIITFWDFPKDQAELRKIAEDIKNDIGLDIYKEKWKIEIMVKPNEWNIQWGTWHPTKDEVVYIPVEDYVSSQERPEEELKTPHLMDWEEKKKLLAKSKVKKWKEWQKPFEDKNYDNEI